MRDWVLAFLGRKAHARDQAIKMEDDVRASSFPDVTARQLRAVLAVAEYRSFIAAAAFLKTSQPALTRTIKQIEGVLGISLFSRSTRQVSITEAGKEFAALAARLLSDLQIGIANLPPNSGGKSLCQASCRWPMSRCRRSSQDTSGNSRELRSICEKAFRATSRMMFTAAWRILDSDMSRTCRSHSQRRALAQRPF